MFIAVVQFNPKVAALTENCERALAMIDELALLPYPPDLVIFPALALSGAELGGLVTHNAFAAEALDVARVFMTKASLPTLIGTVLPRPAMANTRFVCEEEILFAVNGRGSALGFIDMKCNAESQDYVESISIKLNGLTITIILDDFIDPDARYADSDVILSMIARPYQETNGLLTASSQIDSLRTDAISNDAWVVVASLCGGEDSFVYEGASLVLAPDGTVIDSAAPFEEAVFTVNLSRQSETPLATDKDTHHDIDSMDTKTLAKKLSPALSRKHDKKRIRPLLPYEATWKALEVGLRDYVLKNGFEGVVLGLSGGIDSAVVAALASDALGSSLVHAVLMPSPYTQESSMVDSKALAQALGLELLSFPITDLYESFQTQAEFNLGDPGTERALQNLQARLRMVILMHLSNSHGWLLLNTSNKSEIAVGYSTLYGDTAGAISPLGGLYKTDVYGVAHWRNSRDMVIPQSILDKEPSAELSFGQLDSDVLPPYESLDQILRLHIEENLGVDEILELINGYPLKTCVDAATIVDVLDRVKAAEFKRRQEPPSFQFDGINITDHRAWPITNGFNDHSRDIVVPTEIINYLGLLYREIGQGGFNLMDN
ncbi:MAG: NAD(+) synthase [Coriobacteriia bacterium]|nr:NAD(+) synthase [Coriobacteriia bacterium]